MVGFGGDLDEDVVVEGLHVGRYPHDVLQDLATAVAAYRLARSWHGAVYEDGLHQDVLLSGNKASISKFMHGGTGRNRIQWKSADDVPYTGCDDSKNK